MNDAPIDTRARMLLEAPILPTLRRLGAPSVQPAFWARPAAWAEPTRKR